MSPGASGTGQLARGRKCKPSERSGHARSRSCKYPSASIEPYKWRQYRRSLSCQQQHARHRSRLSELLACSPPKWRVLAPSSGTKCSANAPDLTHPALKKLPQRKSIEAWCGAQVNIQRPHQRHNLQKVHAHLTTPYRPQKRPSPPTAEQRTTVALNLAMTARSELAMTALPVQAVLR